MFWNQSLVIQQRNNPVVTCNTTKEASNSIRSHFCINRGISKLRCTFEKDTYTSQDACRVICNLDNSKCGVEISSIRGVLTQIIEIKNGTYHIRRERVVSFIQFPGIGRKMSTNKNPRILEINLKDIVNGLETKKPDQIKPEDYAFAQKLQPSTKGKMVECRYVLEVIPTYNSWGLRAPTPSVKLPLTILPLGLSTWGQIEVPLEWKPVLFPEVKLELDQSINQFQPQKASEHVIYETQEIVIDEQEDSRNHPDEVAYEMGEAI